MLEDAVKRIADAVQKNDSIDSAHKADLLALLAALKSEVRQLSGTHGEHARSIAGFAELAAHEATRREKSPGLLQYSLGGLALSAQGFEASHPKLVETVNQICVMLARIGI